ncbi:MAG: AAA family ATPase [Hylemonella sp.]|uniref:nucleotide-binding protein n=1 Tax=Hylemonella sp. TaxID=2066020 RepID=UPI0022C042B8|nr:division plane positioning ATPase MipZ [Hylemonella sp.]MCZ8251990.1 AAA family ATPase [Hylemonella sp.]
MPVIAVVNRKGGSGKSTLAAHLAAWCAHQGHAVMLGDVDRQQSTRSWLRKRNETLPSIAPWTVDQNILRVPAGITHVILDTPGGLHGFDLARMVMFADVILMPVCGSAFDRESAADCHAELMALPRVATGRCKVACIGMRIDTRTRTPQVLKDWATGLGMPFLGVLRESQAYVQCLERGMTLFDLPADRVPTDLRQWEPILGWLRPQMAVNPAASMTAAQPAAALATGSALPARAPATPSGLPSRLLATPPATTPQVPPASPRPPTQSTAPVAPAAAATASPRLLASRPVPAVTRINSSPRVLDRVASNGALRASPTASRAAEAPVAQEAPPIPSFLKLVKC